MVNLIGDGIIKKTQVSPVIYSKLIYPLYIRTDNPNHDMFDQLGVYYDLRYWRYYKRPKFLAGLSSSNEDEIVELIESELIESTKRRREELEKFNIETVFISEDIAQLVLRKYSELNIRELAICYAILWTRWGVGTVYYLELVHVIIAWFMKLFFSLRHIQDTIQGLIHKGIIIPMIDPKCSNDKPSIYLTLKSELEEEAYRVISG